LTSDLAVGPDSVMYVSVVILIVDVTDLLSGQRSECDGHLVRERTEVEDGTSIVTESGGSVKMGSGSWSANGVSEKRGK
jgi:hypothetical protein